MVFVSLVFLVVVAVVDVEQSSRSGSPADPETNKERTRKLNYTNTQNHQTPHLDPLKQTHQPL